MDATCCSYAQWLIFCFVDDVRKHSGLHFVSSMTLQYQMVNFVQWHNQFQYTKIEVLPNIETYGVHLDSNRIDAKLGLENELVETTVQLIWCYQ